MANIDLTKYGITGATEIIHNPSFEFLYEEEMKPGLEGFDVGQLTELDAVNQRQIHRHGREFQGHCMVDQ